MEIRKLITPTKCDNGACKNLADYEIMRSDTMPANTLRLCKSCLESIVECYAMQIRNDKDE